MSAEHIEMRQPCPECADEAGIIKTRNGQDCVFCAWCGAFQYNAPKTETGREVRKLTRGQIKPKVRAQILIRAGRRCELCGAPVEATNGLAVDHILSVADGLDLGLTDQQLNSLENLAAFCEACNSGKGRNTLPLWLAIAILKARTKQHEEGTRDRSP